MTNSLLRIPLQFFAEPLDKGDIPPDNPDTPPTTPPEVDPKTKQVTMTQAELDDLLDKQFGKGARKGKAEIQKSEPPATRDNSTAVAEETLRKANERLLTGTVRGLCAELSITNKGAKAAVKLADFSTCMDDSGVDEEAVKDALEEFLEEYPEFKKQSEIPNPDTGTGGKPNPARQGKSEIGGLGARLAKQQTNTPTKSSFFKN